MPLLLIFSVAALFLALAIRSRAIALALFCGLLPVYLFRFSVPLAVTSVPTTLLEILFWELFVTWYFLDARKHHEHWGTLEEWAAPMALLFTAATVSTLVSPDLRSALGLWRAYFLEPMLFFPMFARIVSRSKHGIWTLAALGASVAVIGVTAVYQKLTGFGIPNPVWQAEATRRATSFFGFPNAIALLSAPVVVLMLGWALALLREARWHKKTSAALPLAAAALGVCGIVFAVSEGGAMGVAAGVAALGLFDKKLRAWALGGIIAACAVVMLYAPATTYFSNIIGFRDDSTSVRGIIWGDTLKLLHDAPVFGAGLSGYPGRIAPYHTAYWIEIFQYPHDVVLNFWSETGLLGLIAFIWILVRFFRLSYRLAKKDRWIVTTCAAAMVTVLVHGLVDVPYFKNDLAFLFWIIVGIVESVRLASEASLVDKAKAALSGKPGSPWLPEI